MAITGGAPATWMQMRALAWVQWRTIRNHLPRTSLGTLLAFSLGLLWYGGFTVLAVAIATSLPAVSLLDLHAWLGTGLLGVFLFWQLVPLLTLTGGWSLDLKKLQVYPVSRDCLLWTETLLRISAGVEMVLVLLGITAGLLLHPGVSKMLPLAVLLYVPFNLLASLTIRELLLKAFRTRLRELLTVSLLAIGFLPQAIIRLGWSPYLKHEWTVVSTLHWAPWTSVAMLSIDAQPGGHLLSAAGWITLAWLLARKQFGSLLREEDAAITAPREARQRFSFVGLLEPVACRLPDLLGTLFLREMRCLARSPKVRVAFFSAILLSVLILGPLGQFGGTGNPNALAISNLYGLIILGDSLMWNIFGFDRCAAQLYFAAPVSLRRVFQAKNIAAAVWLMLQAVLSTALLLLLPLHVTPSTAITALCVSPTAGLYFISAGNILSVLAPSPMDAKAVMKKQTGANSRVWLLVCSLGSAALAGFAYLAGWATNSAWATRAVLAIEFGIGLIVYHIALDSAVRRAESEQEKLLRTLCKQSLSPVTS